MPFHVGERVLCRLEPIGDSRTRVDVRVGGIDHPLLIEVNELFADGPDANVRFYPGTVMTHEPFDPLMVGRYFYAEVTAVNPLVLSRRAYINTLWRQLESAAGTDRCFLVELSGQNSEYYFVSIEYSLRVPIPREKIDDFLNAAMRSPTTRHKYLPIEGDILLAEVRSISRADSDILLDLAEPLKRLRKDEPEMDAAIVSAMGGSTHLQPFQAQRATLTAPIPPLPKQFAIDQSADAQQLRRRTTIVILDNDSHFREQLAWILREIGYTAQTVLLPAQNEAIHWPVEIHRENTYLLIDLELGDRTGIAVLQEVRSHPSSAWPRCMLMSTCQLDEPVPSMDGLSVRQIIADYISECPFWSKSQDSLERTIIELDKRIIDYTIYSTNVGYGLEELVAEAVLPAVSPSIVASMENQLGSIIEEIRVAAGGERAALFSMDRSSWRAEVVYGDAALLKMADLFNAQTYLPNSPIRDLSFQASAFLFSSDVQMNIPKYKNLLRFFRSGELDEEVRDASGFRSVAAVRLNITTEKRYTLFIFHRQAGHLVYEQVKPLLQVAAERLELILLRESFTYHMRVQQPIYFEGLSRAGLRHDVRAQLTDIEMLVTAARSNLYAGKQDEVIKQLGDIQIIAKESHEHLHASLTRLQPVQDDMAYDVMPIVDWARGIAVGVAARQAPRTKVRFTLSVDSQLPSLWGSPNALRRVLENIAVNAVEHGLEFMSANLRVILHVRIEVRKIDHVEYPVVILVQDTGPGIHGLDRERIFEALFSTKKEGSGMGLAIVKQIAEQRGLRVEIVASPMLCGTSIMIHIPRRMAPVIQKEAP